MPAFELHIPETAGWRALITRAEHDSKICLEPELENYVIYLLLTHVGTPTTKYDGLAGGFLNNLFSGRLDSEEDLATVGDQCLVFAGLFPEKAVQQLIPISYFVRVGRDAYAKHGLQFGDPLYEKLERDFVSMMDVLQCVRDLDKPAGCLDGLAAFEQWRNTGSQHAFDVLKALAPAMPTGGEASDAVH